MGHNAQNSLLNKEKKKGENRCRCMLLTTAAAVDAISFSIFQSDKSMRAAKSYEHIKEIFSCCPDSSKKIGNQFFKHELLSTV